MRILAMAVMLANGHRRRHAFAQKRVQFSFRRGD
jgi:hypothetical protein